MPHAWQNKIIASENHAIGETKMLVMIFHKLVKQKTYVLNVAMIITTVALRVFVNFMRFITLHMKFQLCCNF